MIPRILVVDDEPDLEILIKQKFRKQIRNNEYKFIFAHNGNEALQKLSDDKDIELVLTDINMPEMDGLTLLNKIQELNNPLLRSVIVSAYGDILNIRTAMNGGAFDFVVKPIDLNDLEITIKKALKHIEAIKKAIHDRDELITVQKELKDARELQLSMLPRELPEVHNLEIAVYMKTATEVGGDYYDFSTKDDGSLNVAIGDATGHGMKAGTLVSMMKSLFTANSIDKDIIEFFQSSNVAIKKSNLERMMIGFTMININNGKAEFVNAGLPPIYHFISRKNKIEELSIHSLPLGAMSSDNYISKKIELDHEDVLLMMTDGFPELQNNNEELFGYERVKNAFEKVSSKSPEEIISYLKEKGSDWVNDKDPDDDVTFVVIKVK